jgi:hypothetical protein
METLIPVFIVLFLALAAYAFHASAKRRQDLRRWSQRRGLVYYPGKDRSFDNRYTFFNCLRQGHSRYAENIITGPWNGQEVTCFDYHYTTGSGKNQSHHSFSGAILRSPIPLRPLTIRKEGVFDKIGEFFGADDIDFESAEFSRTFYVKSPDKKWAYDVIHQRMMEYLLAGPRYNLAFGPVEVIAWGGRNWKSGDFELAADHIHGIYDRLPDYLLRQQAGGMER